MLLNSAAFDANLAISFTVSSDTAPKDSKARGIIEEFISVQRLKYLVFLADLGGLRHVRRTSWVADGDVHEQVRPLPVVINIYKQSFFLLLK